MPCLKWSGFARIWSGRGRVGSVLGAVLVLRRKRFLVEMEGKIFWNQVTQLKSRWDEMGWRRWGARGDIGISVCYSRN